MRRITHYEVGDRIYFSSRIPSLNAAIMHAFSYLDDPFDRNMARQLMAENEVTFNGRGPAEFLFTDEHCDLILSGIDQRFREPFISNVELLAWSISAGRIEKAIQVARGEPHISADNN
ncbi:MAG: hypothetical protein ABSB12_03060 [Candidatus Saccharimonadales bacterium]